MEPAIYNWVRGGQPTRSETTLDGFTVNSRGEVFFEGNRILPDEKRPHQGADGSVERYTAGGHSIIVKRQRETPSLIRRLETAGRLQLCGLVNFKAFKTGAMIVTVMEALDGDLHDEMMAVMTIQPEELKRERVNFLWRKTAGAIGSLIKCLRSERRVNHTYTDIKPENIGIKHGEGGTDDQLRIIDIDSIDHNTITYRIANPTLLLGRDFVATKLPWYETLNAAMVTLMLVMTAHSDEEHIEVYDKMVGEPKRHAETMGTLLQRKTLAKRYQAVVKGERRPDETDIERYDLNAAEFIFKAGIHAIDRVIEENGRNQPPKPVRPRSWDDPNAGGKQQKMLPGI
jgi:hypothetical protein